MPDRRTDHRTGWVGALLILLAVTLVVPGARADDGPTVLTLAEYRSNVLQSLAALRSAEREPNADTRRDLVDMAVRYLPPTVNLADRAGATLDQRSLRQPLIDLRARPLTDPIYWQTAESLLVQIGLDAGLTPDQVGAATTPTVAPEPVDQDAAQRRLAADWRSAGQTAPAWLQRSARYVRDWLDKVGAWLDGFAGKVGVSGPTRYVVTGALAVLLVVGFVLVVRLFERRRHIRVPVPTGEEQAWAMASATEALTRADQLASAGEYSRALRWLHRAALGRLDEAGLVRFRPATTDWEYLSGLRSAPPAVQEALQFLTDRYQLAFFGRRPADGAVYDQGRAAFLRLQAGTPGKARPGGEAVAP